MRYGFVIDQERCIGCHACTVACKEEHQVPIGVFRTWVKYIETGEFPQSRRHFGVMRCNHCDDAPCVEICPTSSLFRRSDGIVDFDNQRCIGCKSCMQACPYDALYIDPNSHTAAKCNFCAHRVEKDLEPACVIVCPTQAILAGDLDDPASKVAKVIAGRETSARKPEKGTQPKLRYVGIQQDLLQPTKLAKQNGYLWADRRDSAAVANFDSAETREVYDVAHPAPWGWKIAAYLWTKSVAAGVLLIAALLMSLGGSGPMLNVVSPVIALVFLAATTALLVFDLKRPDRFFYLITKPNFRSWLVLGGYILMFYGAMAAVWLVMGVTQNHIPAIVVWPTVVLAIATAGYSAFLFGQAKGRDFWRHKWFTFWQLVIQALIAGSAVLEICFMQADSEDGVLPLNALLTISSILLVLGLANAILEIAVTRKTEEERIARRFLTQGAAGRRFRYSVMVLGLILPLLLTTFWVFVPIAIPIAAALALYGLFWFEYLWVQAGQAAPLS